MVFINACRRTLLLIWAGFFLDLSEGESGGATFHAASQVSLSQSAPLQNLPTEPLFNCLLQLA
jgi:hypothetical protein